MCDGFYPAGVGLINYLFNSAYEPFGTNRWSNKTDATSYAEDIQPYFPGTDCHVVSEYFTEAPDYQWRVICNGKSL